MNTPLPKNAEAFLRDVGLALSPLPAEEREDLLAELRSHLLDRASQGRDDAVAEFGPAEQYASAFLAERALSGALASGTSWSLGRALLVGARDLLRVLLLLVPLGLLHVIGLALLAVGALKPFFPANVGVFVPNGGRLWAIGYVSGDLSGSREVLGWWALPVFLVSGALLLWAANRGLRAAARSRLERARMRRVS